MDNPDLPPDSITTLPAEQRTAAIRERYNDMAYSGPTPTDRERDTVIGWLLDRLETAERHMLERDDENTLLTEELQQARDLYEHYCMPPETGQLIHERDNAAKQAAVLAEQLEDLRAEFLHLRAQLKDSSEWGQRVWNAWRSARDRAQRARAAFPVFQTPAGPVTVHHWPAAPTPQKAEAAKQAVLETAVALYDEQQPAPGRVPAVTVGQDFTPEHRYVLRAYRQAHGQPTVGAGTPTAVEVNGAVTWWNQQQAPTVEVTTSEPDAALYFVCRNRHPLAARTTTIIENGERHAVHHEVVCPACEADGITEVRLPDLDDEADDD